MINKINLFFYIFYATHSFEIFISNELYNCYTINNPLKRYKYGRFKINSLKRFYYLKCSTKNPSIEYND